MYHLRFYTNLLLLIYVVVFGGHTFTGYEGYHGRGSRSDRRGGIMSIRGLPLCSFSPALANKRPAN